MSKHTPGPWRVGTAGPNKCPTVGTKQGLMVAMVSYGENHPTYANASLIAAAPDLLGALQTFLSMETHIKDGASPLIDLGRAAVAKALGREGTPA